MRGHFKSTITLSTIGCLLLLPSVSTANDADSLAKFMACAEIENPPLRYACFDETAAAVKAMQVTSGMEVTNDANAAVVPSASSMTPAPSTQKPMPAPTTIVESATQTEKVKPADEKSGLFGFIGGLTKKAKTEEEFGLQERPDEEDTVTEITGNISDFRISGTGRLIVLLDNGQIWQQISGDTTRLPERIMQRQTSANIEQAALGSYLMRLSPAEQSIRVRRIR